MKYIFFVLLIILGQTSFAADLFNRYEPRQFKIGDHLEPNATIGGHPIWNGEGKWQIFEIKRYDSTGVANPVPMGRIGLIQTENKKTVATMVVTANLSTGNASDWTDEPCKRQDILFRASLGGTFKNINCITINHISDYMKNPSGQYAELFSILKKEEIDIPPTVLRITFTRYSSSQRWYSVVLTINPELAGFPRTYETWGRSAWHKSQLLDEPERKKFIDALGEWASLFAKQMDKALEKEPDAFINIPTWRSIFEQQTPYDTDESKHTFN